MAAPVLFGEADKTFNSKLCRTDGEELSSNEQVIRRRKHILYRFSRTRQGQAACGGGCVYGLRNAASGSESNSNDPGAYCSRYCLGVR